ncbi:hypothetical protein PR048_020020 [Dryococelus australis]|uniref:Endonuclease-reverse transcriptase n=1 Tax=Dryococelus australis TaxID=614101 RepID=A0ABQ9H552_9NEOP|nr:hypothetical protein PR048_020020 [Dryococelus australis]
MNIEKTKYLPINLKKIEDFKYLRGLLNERNIMEKDILTRIQAGNRCSFSMRKMLKSKLLSRTSKLMIYKTIIQPVLLYGAELWTLTKLIENKQMTFENGILRQIFGPVKEGYEWRSCLMWYGHIMRRDGDLVKYMVERCFEEKKPHGIHRIRWLDATKEDIRMSDIPEEEWRDRALWRRLVGEARDRLWSVMPP